jgi:hypothetical protein
MLEAGAANKATLDPYRLNLQYRKSDKQTADGSAGTAKSSIVFDE